MATLLIILLALAIATAVLAGTLLLLRHRRRARRADALQMFDEKRISTSSTHSNHRRVTARPSQSVHIYHDKETSVETYSAPPSPTSSLPEIRITFPEEIDVFGKRKSGGVVVVRVGDTGVGLEPLSENLPAYQQSEDGRFQSVDLERAGGLIEKARNSRSPPNYQ